MATKDIKLLDNFIEENKNYNNTIHALANMGQRMGVKGDSIIYNSFELIDIFNVNLDNNNVINFEGVKENIDDYIGYLYYVNDDNGSIICKFGAIKKTQLLESKKGYINNSDTLLNSINCNFTNIDSNIFGEFKINNEESLKIEGINILNNINSYNKNSVIKIKNNHLYSLLFGKIVNSDNIEIIYNDFDLKTNELKYALRAIKGNDDSIYVLYEFDINDTKNPFLKVYNLNLKKNNNLNNNLRNIFNTYFVEETNIDNLDISDINDIKSSKFIFEYFLNYSSSINTYNLSYNDENNTKLYLKSTTNVDENINTIIERINYINNDINVLIPALIKYYHNNFFSININTIILRMLQNVYETMCYKHYVSYSIDNINDKNINFNDNRFVLYFPLNYKVTYECNKNNIFDIYNINDLYIHRLNLENYDSDLISYNELLNNILFSSNTIKQSMFDVYNLTFDYNSYYDNNYIANINSIYLHTLPYIDKSNYNWYINGQNSGLRSYINNSLFQYFVIINTLKIEANDIQGEYLTNIPNDLSSYFNDKEFIVKNFEISYERINNSTDVNIVDNITFKTLLPKISTYDLTDIYKNTLVISLSKINDTQNIKDVLMCTLWKYNGEDWEILKNSKTNDVLDLKDFLNLGLLKYRSLNTKDYIFNYFGMLMNDIKDYHNPYGNEIIKLALLKKDTDNNLGLNLSVVSSNKISITDNKLNTNVNDITQTERYINRNTDIKEITRNNITISGNNSNEIFINSDDSTTSSTLLSYEPTSTINLENYKDYTFKNVPLLDLSEIILEHPQMINRLNLISLDNNNYIYNTIIGVDLDKNKKNVFTIKPSSLNVDIGTKTLIDEKSIKSFKTLDTISIDFNNIELKGNVKSGLIRQELTNNSYILYKDIILIGNDVIKINNTGKHYINISELLEKNNISDEFSDTNGFSLVQNNNDIENGTNGIIYINSNISSIDNINICTKTLRIIKYYNNNSNNTKNIIMLV